MIKPTKYPVGPDDMADLFDQAANQGKQGKQDTLVSGTNIKTINGSSVLGSGNLTVSSTPSWGSITGTLGSQSDLNTALNGKESSITAGTTAQYYRGDKTFQTLDKSAVGLGNVDNTSDANKPISTATQTALNAKASTGAITGTGITMSTARILGRSTTGTGAIEEITIGSGLTLSAGTLTASGGSSSLTIGTTAIASGTVGRILFEGTGNVLQESANLFWDNTNGRLGIGTSSPSAPINIVGGTEVTSGEQRALILETSATNKTSLELLLNNTFTSTGRTWRIRSLSGGDFDIATSTTRYFYISNSGKIVINGSSPISTAQFSVNGSMASNGGIQVQAGLSAPTGAGFELEYTGGIAYITSYNRTSSSWLPITIRGSLIDFVSSGTSTTRIATTGNFLINTTTDAGYKLDVNGTTRIQNKLSVGTPSAASAVMEITSTTQGFLPPRMTTAQKNAIASPAAGLVVYDTTLNKLCVRTASAWETITSL